MAKKEAVIQQEAQGAVLMDVRRTPPPGTVVRGVSIPSGHPVVLQANLIEHAGGALVLQILAGDPGSLARALVGAVKGNGWQLAAPAPTLPDGSDLLPHVVDPIPTAPTATVAFLTAAVEGAIRLGYKTKGKNGEEFTLEEVRAAGIPFGVLCGPTRGGRYKLACGAAPTFGGWALDDACLRADGTTNAPKCKHRADGICIRLGHNTLPEYALLPGVPKTAQEQIAARRAQATAAQGTAVQGAAAQGAVAAPPVEVVELPTMGAPSQPSRTEIMDRSPQRRVKREKAQEKAQEKVREKVRETAQETAAVKPRRRASTAPAAPAAPAVPSPAAPASPRRTRTPKK